MKNNDPADLRTAITQGWEHLNLSYEQVMATRAYQYDGDPIRLPPVLAQRRADLIGTPRSSQAPPTGKVTQGGPGGRRKGRGK